MKERIKQSMVKIILAVVAILSLAALGVSGSTDTFFHNDQSFGVVSYGVENVADKVCQFEETIVFNEEKKPSGAKNPIPLESKLRSGLSSHFKKQGYWPSCGVIYRNPIQIDAMATEYANYISEAGKKYGVDIFGLAATMIKESGMDTCAVGPNVRRTAYKIGVLKKSKLTISHAKSEVIRALNNQTLSWHYSKTGYDVGLAQMMQRYYDHPSDIDRILEPDYASMQAAKEMARRSELKNTDRPWYFWRGKKSSRYGSKVDSIAEKLRNP